jgi:hypothetical protein
VNVQATRRTVILSLWRPDLSGETAESVGVPVEFLPNDVWSLGLGHLGQAYLWCLGMLPFVQPKKAKVLLQDFEEVVPANLGTGLLTWAPDIGRLKTRVACGWLERLGFQPCLVERPFDEGTRRYPHEPSLALCGFDGRGPRHLLDGAGFGYVIDSGLGGTADDFDCLDFHTLGNPSLPASEIWPLSAAETGSALAEAEVLKNPYYRSVRDQTGCGHMQLAGVSVAVPFVGAVAASLVLAEPLRLFHGGERYEHMRLRLACLERRHVRVVPDGYRGRLSPRIAFQEGVRYC